MVNADGSKNHQHDTTHVACFRLKLGRHSEVMEALVLEIGKNEMLLGQDWLAAHNPSIDWSSHRVALNRCPTTCRSKGAVTTVAQTKADNLDENGVLKGTKPAYLALFGQLFEQKEFIKLPGRQIWDHEIKLTEDAPKELPAWNYRMMPVEAKALDDYLNVKLKASKIQTSNSPYTTPCFFIAKMDGRR